MIHFYVKNTFVVDIIITLFQKNSTRIPLLKWSIIFFKSLRTTRLKNDPW